MAFAPNRNREGVRQSRHIPVSQMLGMVAGVLRGRIDSVGPIAITLGLHRFAEERLCKTKRRYRRIRCNPLFVVRAHFVVTTIREQGKYRQKTITASSCGAISAEYKRHRETTCGLCGTIGTKENETITGLVHSDWLDCRMLRLEY